MVLGIGIEIYKLKMFKSPLRKFYFPLKLRILFIILLPVLLYPIIIIYFWILKRPNIMGTGHIFVTGLINDVVMGFPLGISSLTYLVVCFFSNYVRNKSVNTTIASDWFTFLIAVFFSNLTFLILIYNFTELSVTYTEIFYNSFFTLLFYPLFWLIFNIYRSIAGMKNYD